LGAAVQAAGCVGNDINCRLNGNLGTCTTINDAMNAAQDVLKHFMDVVVANSETYQADTSRLGVGNLFGRSNLSAACSIWPKSQCHHAPGAYQFFWGDSWQQLLAFRKHLLRSIMAGTRSRCARSWMILKSSKVS